MEENNRGNTQQNTQNGQGIQGQQNSPQGASFGTQNTGGKVIGNDTAAVGSGGIVSLKGGQTQREIDEQRKIEELKSRAVKLERKLTPKEKELERMHKEAVKPSTLVPQQSGKRKTSVPGHTPGGPTKGWQTVHSQVSTGQKEQTLAVSKVDHKKQEEQVENLINPIENPKVGDKKLGADIQQPATKNTIKTITKQNPAGAGSAENTTTQAFKKKTEKNIVNKITENKTKRRMVISPAGQISYTDDPRPKSIQQESKLKSGPSNNVVDLKAKEEDTQLHNDKDDNIIADTEFKQTPKIPEIPWEEKKVDLKSLTPEKRLDLQSTPSMASVNFNMDDDFNREMVAWFDRYNELPVNIKLGLGSSEVRQKIKELASKLGLLIAKNPKLTEGKLGEISRIIRDIYVNLIKEEEIKNRIKSVLKIQEPKIKNVLANIANIVALVKDVGNKKSEEYFEKLSLQGALEKYPKIKDEEITSGIIVDKKTGEYIKPTVQNWMDDYINKMGSGQHTNLERGKYLSDSTNVKNLDEEDKKIVAKLIKSQDQNSKLIIDREEGVVLWNLHQDESHLGINSDKDKRVINKFKIEEAQSADVDNDEMTAGALTERNIPKVDNFSKLKNNLENSKGDSIIKSSQEKTVSPTVKKETTQAQKEEKQRDGLLDLSSEIPVRESR